MQGMVAGKRSRGKPRQRWKKDTTDIFGTMATASRVAEDRTFGQRRPEELTWLLDEISVSYCEKCGYCDCSSTGQHPPGGNQRQ